MPIRCFFFVVFLLFPHTFFFVISFHSLLLRTRALFQSQIHSVLPDIAQSSSSGFCLSCMFSGESSQCMRSTEFKPNFSFTIFPYIIYPFFFFRLHRHNILPFGSKRTSAIYRFVYFSRHFFFCHFPFCADAILLLADAENGKEPNNKKKMEKKNESKTNANCANGWK